MLQALRKKDGRGEVLETLKRACISKVFEHIDVDGLSQHAPSSISVFLSKCIPRVAETITFMRWSPFVKDMTIEALSS